MIDMTTDFGARVARRLQNERIVWLTTVRANGQPEPNPVWFLWDGESIIIFSPPDAHKVHNIMQRPKVSLHLNSDEFGGDVVIFAGEASIVPDVHAADAYPALVEKYRPNLDVPGSITTEQFVNGYSTAIRVIPTRLRGM
jgi:PPOX class probable F420-dependent enzyme